MATKTRTLKAGGATRAKRPEASTANLVVCASVPRGAEDGKNAKRELLQRNVKACSAPTSAAAAMTGTPSPLDQKAKAAPTPTADKVSASPSRGPSKRVTYTSNSSKAGKSERAPSESMHKDTLCSRKKGEDDPTQKLMPPDGKTTADKTHTVEKRSARCNVPSSDAATSAVSNTDSNSAPSVSGTGGPGVQKRPADTDATPLKRSSWPCKSWDANGYCPKGDACHRRHRKLVVPNGSSVSGESPATAKQAVAHSGGDPRQHAPPSSQALQADQAKLNVEDPTKVSSGDRLEQTPVQPLSDHERSANNSPEVVSASKDDVEVCRLHLTGRCFYWKCRFLHDRYKPSTIGAATQRANSPHGGPSAAPAEPNPRSILDTASVLEDQAKKSPKDGLEQHTEQPSSISEQSAASPQVDSSASKDVEVCRLYLARRCFYGSRCRFLHERHKLPITGATSQSAPAGLTHKGPSADSAVQAASQGAAPVLGSLLLVPHPPPPEKPREQVNTSQSFDGTAEATVGSQPAASLTPAKSDQKEWNPGIVGLAPKPRVVGLAEIQEERRRKSIVSRLVDGRLSRERDEVCGFHLRGQCEYGESCTFTHTFVRDMRPARETREICKPYLRGECVYHARCLRYHVDIKDEEGSAPAALSDTSVAEPSSQSSEVEATLPRSVADGGSSHDEPRASPPSGELPRFVLLEEQVDHRPARVLNTVCYAYHFGSCKYGDACERTHALPERVVLCTNVSPSKLRDHVPKAGDNKEFPKANDVDELMDFNGQRREDSIAAPLTVRAAQDQPRHLPHNVALLPRASNTSSRKGMRRGGQISSLMNSDQAISRRPLTDVLDASANLPAPPGKGTIPSDLLASIRPQPTCMQLGNQCHTERSTGDVFSATSAMEDSTASIHRSHRLSEERNGHGKTRSGKSTDVPSSELRDAVLDDMQRNMDSCSPSTAHLLDVFFGGPSGARMSNVGPRLWSSMDIPRHLERASKDHSDGLSKLSSSSSGHSFELDDSVCKTSPHSSVSSLPSPHTSPEPMSLAYDVLQPTTGHRLHDESTPLKQHSEAKVERNSTNAIRGNVDHTEARPPRSKTRPERRPAVPLIDASRQVNVPLVPPGLGLESKVMPPSHPAPPRETANPTFMVLSSTRVTYGPGFEVCSVTTGFEPREVMLTNLPRNVTCAAITAALQPFGVVTSVSVSSKDRECKRGTAIARVTFATPDQARQAIAALDDAELFDTTVNARLLTGRNSIPGKARLTDGDVLLEFPCPHKTAYVGYSSLAVAEQAISKANGTELKGNWVTAKLHEGLPSVGSCTVQMCGLPVDTEVKDFNRYGKFEDIMFQRPNYTSLRSATDTLRNKLEKSGGLLSFNVLPPPYKRSTVRVYAHFDSAAAARRVCANFHNTLQPSCGYGKLYAKYAPALLYSLPAGVYDALAADIHLLTSYVWKTFEPGSSISVVDRRTSACSTIPVTVKLASQRMQSLTKMKSHFEPLLRGEKVTQDGEVVWDGFFARSGGAHFLEGLERRHAGVIINKDPRRRTLALFGPARKRETVRSEILAKVTELRKQKTQVIPLPGRLIGLFCGSDLANLQWRYGQDNIELDPWGRVLRVRGEDDVYDAALLAMKRVRDRHSGERQRHQVECPVCFDDVVSPIKLECGHTWCKSCLQRYLRASVENKSFPLTCLGDEARCSHRIPISVAQDVLSTKDFEDVVHASFRAYVHSRPLEYHYCPTPDCEQVYRVASEDSVLQCPSCLVRICPKCHSEYHEGNACRYSETVSQMLFEEWKGSHDVKDCPNCKMTIEREAGCNHMQCTRCQTHICWNCRATFDTSGEVYEHMRLMHGGIGL